MFKLNERQAIVGVPNLRVEQHGEDEVAAVDIPITALAIGPEELGELLHDAEAATHLYRLNGDFAEARWPGLKPLELADKIEGVRVQLWLGSAKNGFVLVPCDLKGIKLHLDGQTHASFKVQYAGADVDEIVERIARHMNGACRVALEPGQADLVDEAEHGLRPEDFGAVADESEAPALAAAGEE